MPAHISRMLPCLLILAAAGSLFAGPAYGPGPTPAFVVPVDFDTLAQAPEGQIADGIFLILSDVQVDVGSQSRFTHSVRKVVSEEGLSIASRITIGFNPFYEDVRVHRIDRLRGGRKDRLLASTRPVELRREEDLENGMLDGRKSVVYNLEDVRVGDIVEYAYTLKGQNPIFQGKASGGAYLGASIPIGRRYFRLAYPADRELRVKGLAGASPGKLRGIGPGWERVWDDRGIQAQLVDYDAPSWHNAYARLQWSEFPVWADVSDWALGMYDFHAPLSPALQDWVRRHGNRPAREQVRSALRLVQDSIRYLGLELGESSHRPALPSLTYARRFGDCKDKVFLFCILLKRMGIRADPALVNTIDKDGLGEFLPAPTAFDHVIAKVVLDGRYYWFDATIQGQRGDPFELQALPYRKALSLDQGHLEDIMVGPAARGMAKVKLYIDLPKWDSAASLRVESAYTMAEAEAMRATLSQGNRAELRKTYQDFYAARFPRIRAEGGLEVEDDTAANRITVRERYSIDSLCSRDATTGRLECSIYPQEVGTYLGKPDRLTRNSPYALAFPKHIHQQIDIRLPELLDLERDEGREFTKDFEFTWKEFREGKVLRFVYEYEAQADHVPVERFDAYLNALERINANLGATLYPESGRGGGYNYLFILFSLGCLGGGVWAARRLMALRPWPARVGDGTPALPLGGWLWLMAIGISVGPILYLVKLSEFDYLVYQSSWKALTTRGSENFHPLWEPFLLFITAVNLIGLCLSVALVRLFFKRQANFPFAFLIANLVAFVGLAADQLAGLLIPAVAGQMTGADSPAGVARAVLFTVAWTVYLFRSQRARNTFVVAVGAPAPAPAVVNERESEPPSREPDAQAA